MQDTLIKETNLERLQRIRKEYYNNLVDNLRLLDDKKKLILNNYNTVINQIDKDIINEWKKQRLKK